MLLYLSKLTKSQIVFYLEIGLVTSTSQFQSFFPMLHLCILLKQAIAVDASSPDAPDELESIELSVLHIPICDSTDDDVSRNQNRSSQLRKSRITTQSMDIDNETAHNSRQRSQTLAGTRSDDISINKEFYATSTRLIQDKIKRRF